MKDVSTAAVYVSPDGDDSNSGMTAAESVRTIGRGIEIAQQKNLTDAVINVAGGSYSGDIDISNMNCTLVISGNISISGRIFLVSSSTLFIRGSYNITITHSGSSGAIDLRDGSHFVAGNIYVVSNGITVSAVSLVRGSRLFLSNLYISGTGCAGGISCSESTVIINSNLSIGDILTSGYAINIAHGYISATGTVSLYSSSTQSVVYCHAGSCFSFSNVTINTKSTASCIQALDACVGYISHFSITSSVSLTSFLQIGYNSYTWIGGTIALNGTVSHSTIWVNGSGVLVVDVNSTISGSVTGKRYDAITGGYINVSGKGANRFPGTTAGTIGNSITVKDTGNTNRTFSMDGSYYG